MDTNFRQPFIAELATILIQDMEEINQQTADTVTLTLENFKEVTGHRFRLTKAEKEAGMTREDAFASRQQSTPVEVTSVPDEDTENE